MAAICSDILRLVHLPGAALKVALDYTGYQSSEIAGAMRSCKVDDAALMMHAVKLYNNPEGTKFYCLTRIYSGTVKGTVVIASSEPFHVFNLGFLLLRQSDSR